MNLFRVRPAYPKDRDLVRVVRAAASRLADKFEKLDVSSLDFSPDTRDLFEHRRKELSARIGRSAQVFAWSLPRNEKPFTDLAVVAFNDGFGMYSLLAKECNTGTVVYHDSNDALRYDARTIARAIGEPADHYVFGDTEEVEFVVNRHSIACDVFVSSGVPVARTSIAPPRPLTAFLNTISERSMGALSVALAGEEPSTYRAPGQPSANGADSLSRELRRTGFDVKIIRSCNRSGGSFIIAGSRPTGTYVLDDEPPSSAIDKTAPRPSKAAHEPHEIPTR